MEFRGEVLQMQCCFSISVARHVKGCEGEDLVEEERTVGGAAYGDVEGELVGSLEA